MPAAGYRWAWGRGTRAPGFSAPTAGSAVALEDADVGEVPVLLGEVEPVADHELRGDVEPDVAEVLVGLLEPLPHEQCAHLEAVGTPSGQGAAQVRQREPRVDDVLHDQHVP